MRDESIEQWLADLASRTPAPGGGAAAALSLATAAALVSMVAVFTTGERWADVSDRMEAIDAEASALRLEALALAEEDASAFGAVGAAYGLPKGTPEEATARTAAIQDALIGAAGPPRRVGEAALSVIALAEDLIDAGNPNVISDVAVASSLARSALESAIVNVEINRALIDDPAIGEQLDGAIETLGAGIQRADSVTASVRARLRSNA